MLCKSDDNMEDVIIKNDCPPESIVVENDDVKSTDSAENFQKFMYELFEKNGVINDLRAYLRGHIVGLLRSTRTGDPPPCQKNFTQRLELPYQALNMLIAEYLLSLEFSYTLSVFISEIPLANMVFAYAKSLMQGEQTAALRFKDEDVWSILNFLGIKCDSEHAASVVEMYRKKESPLLMCMIKCMHFHKDPISVDNTSSQDSLSSSVSSESRSHRSSHKCKHVSFCKTCRGNILKIKEKYTSKKRTLAKKKEIREPQNMDPLMKNIDIIERSLINEMFQQLKSVYETEIQMVKTEEEVRVKKSLASHLVQLQKRKAEMEENFRTREMELERNVQSKKRFLWGLARLLREQHQQMAKAMQDIQDEAGRLTAKEDSLKCQLAEAEKALRQRGEDMRQMISNELVILEQHLESMRKERDTINKERSELEHLKHLYDSTTKTTNLETCKDDLRSHYDLLKNEFNLLKTYLENIKLEPKCVMERSTVTDTADGSTGIDGILNNGQDLDRSKNEDRVKPKRVVNDLKKMKNVNFSQANLTEIYERSRSSTASSEAGDADTRDITQLLREENERLRIFARQQREHIDELSSQQARLSAELTAARAEITPAPAQAQRPRTAPATLHNPGSLLLGGNSNVASRGFGWKKGAGEEMSFFVDAQPRIVVPGDTLPFIGVVSARHTDNRRYLINQWRSLRRRMSPVGGSGKTRANATSPTRDFNKERASSAGPSFRTSTEESRNNAKDSEVTMDVAYQPTRDIQYEQKLLTPEKLTKDPDKSTKAVLRKAKDRIKKDKAFRHFERDESPNTVLRDAKLRLRKLEIEAEAVEKSYLDFRRKQEALRGERRPNLENDVKHDRSSYDKSRMPESTSQYVPPKSTREQIIEDINEYQAKYDISVTRFANKTATSSKIKPIPPAYAYETLPKTKRNQNYVDTPLTEFRKYYQSGKRGTSKDLLDERPGTSVGKNVEYNSRPRSPYTPQSTNDARPSSPTTKSRKASSEARDSRITSPIDKRDPKSPKNRDNSPTSNSDTKSRPQSPKAKNGAKSPKMEGLRQIKQNKAKELEILKQNISKIYNFSDETMADDYVGFDEAVHKAKWELEKDIKGIINETIIEASPVETCSNGSKELTEDKNLLKVEIQTANQVNEVKMSESQSQNLLLVVESSIANASDSETDIQQDMKSTQMTILVSPKRNLGEETGNPIKEIVEENSSEEKSDKLSDQDILNAIYQAEQNENKSSTEIKVESSKGALVQFLSDGNEDPDYPDDFTAEVEILDNLNSQKDDTDDRSPISMAKISDDENFWDS